MKLSGETEKPLVDLEKGVIKDGKSKKSKQGTQFLESRFKFILEYPWSVFHIRLIVEERSEGECLIYGTGN